MDYNKIKKELLAIHDFMDESVAAVEGVTKDLQQRIYNMLMLEVHKFDTVDGRFVPTQDYRRKILDIEDRINNIIGVKKYKDSIISFLNSFDEIQNKNIELHFEANEIVVPANILTPSRQIIYENAKNSLIPALNENFVQPVKMVLLKQVVGGSGISETQTMLTNWNTEVSNPRMRVPNMDQYVTQVARDSAYGVHRNINNIVKEKFGLTSFVYVGGIIKDSRPFCKHLVNLNRKIKLSEIPQLAKEYPQGLYPDTTMKNFMQVCGGYSCRHQALAVRQE